MSDPRTDLPAPGAPNFNQRLREVIQTYLGRQGNPLDRGLTIRDLVDTGVLKLRAGFQLKPGAGSSVPLEPGDGVVDTYEPDLTPPPTPGNMTVTASISHVMIEHEAPIYRQGHGHLRTRVYGKVVNAGDPLPTFADAAEIGQFSGTIYAQPSNPATTWRLWIKWETNDGVLSVDPAGGINGMEAVTGQDVALLLEALSGKITSSQLYADLNARIDLIDGPPTLSGSISQRIASEQIARANEIQAERQARAAALLAEAQARGTAISSETQSRITADSALQQQINMLSAAGSGDFSQLLAAIQEEQTARIAGDAAEATQRTTLAAQVVSLQETDLYNEQQGDILNHGIDALAVAERIRSTAALEEEKTVRATQDEALSQRITTLSATVGQNAATLTAEQTARATADEALSSSLQSLTAKVNTNTASITAEQQARATADSALTTSINYLQAQVNGNAASITSEATSRANADSSLSSRIDTLTAVVNTADASLSAAIQSEATARANADSAEAQARETLAARVTNAEGSINAQAVQIYNRYTKAETDSAISSSSQALSAAYQAADAATLTSAKAHADAGILSEQTARANADSALASSISTLGATVNSNNTTLSAAIQNEATARANADASQASQISTLQSTVATRGAGAALNADPNFSSGLAWDVFSGSAPQFVSVTDGAVGKTAIRSSAAGVMNWINEKVRIPINPEKAYRAQGKLRTVSGSDSFAYLGVALFDADGNNISGDGSQWYYFASNQRPGAQWVSYSGEFGAGTGHPFPSNARTMAPLAILSYGGGSSVHEAQDLRIEDLTDVKLLTASIQTEATTRASQTGELYAKYGVKLDVNGYVTGWAMNNNGAAGDMIVLADRFAVGAPGGGNIVPFTVNTTPQTINGVYVPAGTYMDAAYIKNGTVTNAKIGNAAIDDAKIANLSASKLTAGTIAVGQWIASANYISGAQGWAIWGNGNAEFGAASIRGQLAASQINTEGLTIKHNGQVIMGAGASLPAQFVTPDGGWLNSNLVPSINAAATTASWSGVSGKPRTFTVRSYGNGYVAPPGWWNGLKDTDTDTLIMGTSRSYILVNMSREGTVYYQNTYDVYGQGQITEGRHGYHLANDLNWISQNRKNSIIVVYTADEPLNHRLEYGLPDALYNCGASKAIFGSPNFKMHSAYILVGIAGCGEGNGAEIYAGDVNTDPDSWCELTFQLHNGALNVSGMVGSAKSVKDLDYTGDLNATVGAPAGTYVGSIPAQNVESQTGAQSRADSAQYNAQVNAAWDASTKANNAQYWAEVNAANDATNKANAARSAAEAYAAAQAELARVNASAYADGKVTAEERRAIADASAKAEAARVAAVNAAAEDATSKANWARSAAVGDVTPSINAKLNRAGDTISGRFYFAVPDGIFAGNDLNNGVYFGQDGLVGRKNGANTFYINTLGDAVFSGSIDAATMNSGRINLQHSGSWDWGYARSYNKGWDDGQNGWIFARHADGSTFAEMRAGSNRIWMSNWNDCGIQFPGITMTNGGLTISQANVINTLQLAGNSATVSDSTSGAGGVISTTILLKANTTLKVVLIVNFESFTVYGNYSGAFYAGYSLSIDGNSVGYSVSRDSWDGDANFFSARTYMHSVTLYGGSYDRAVTVSASASDIFGAKTVQKVLAVFGMMR